MFVDDIYAAGLCYGLELAAGESHNGVGEWGREGGEGEREREFSKMPDDVS